MAKSLYPIPARGFSPVMATIEHWSWSASNRPGLHWAGKEIANSPLCAQDPSGRWWDSMLQGQRWPHRPPGVRSTWHKLLPSTKHSPARMGRILIPSGKGLLWNSNLFGTFAASHLFWTLQRKRKRYLKTFLHCDWAVATTSCNSKGPIPSPHDRRGTLPCLISCIDPFHSRVFANGIHHGYQGSCPARNNAPGSLNC